MDPSSSDLEFFDFKNSSDEEIKEIQAILKGPGSNGCVELPWELPVNNNCVGDLTETEGVAEADLAFTNKPNKTIEVGIESGLNYAQSPVSQLPTVEPFVSLPTTVGPYQNAPYFVSRTIPYLRAYPPMGVPFFACPIPPGTGEANPYGQFVPVATEKSDALQLENECTPNAMSNAQSSRQVDKRNDLSEPCPKPAVPICPSSVPLVPLPPSTFAVAGYPPGLHTLSYQQMAGQATSPAMYYVPVFNHPYGGYLPSPPIMLPDASELDKCSSRVVEIDGREEPTTEAGSPGEAPPYSPAADCEPFEESVSDVQPDCQQDGNAMLPAKTTEVDSSLSSSKPPCEGSSPSYLQKAETMAWSDCPSEPEALSLCLQETLTSDDCRPEPVVRRDSDAKVDEISTDECLLKTFPSNYSPSEHVRAKVDEPIVRDPSRCWADLFKSPREVNGVDRHPPKQRSTLKKDITNGKVHSMSVNH